MTSIGDLYGHALVDSYDIETRVARSFDATRPGSCAIPISDRVEDRVDDKCALSIGGSIQWRLCNDFPVQSSAILPQPTANDDIAPSITFSRRLIPANTDKRQPPGAKLTTRIGLSSGSSELLPLTLYEQGKGSSGNQDESRTKKVKFSGLDGILSHCIDSSMRVAQSNASIAPFSIDTSHATVSIDLQNSCSVITGKEQKRKESDEESDVEYDEEMEIGKSSLTKFRADWARGVKSKGKVQNAEGLRSRGRRLPMSYRVAASTGSSEDEQIGSI